MYDQRRLQRTKLQKMLWKKLQKNQGLFKQKNNLNFYEFI